MITKIEILSRYNHSKDIVPKNSTISANLTGYGYNVMNSRHLVSYAL